MDAELAVKLIRKIYDHVVANGSYIPRPYQSIGGMWTVDTWELGYVKVQLQDEGYTQAVITTDLRVATTAGREPSYYQGGPDELLALAKMFKLEEE